MTYRSHENKHSTGLAPPPLPVAVKLANLEPQKEKHRQAEDEGDEVSLPSEMKFLDGAGRHLERVANVVAGLLSFLGEGLAVE